MQYFTVESDLPFRAEVVWAAVTNPETYNLWFEGLIETDPVTPLRLGEDLTLTVRTVRSGPKGSIRKLSFDITALRAPKENEGLLAFEGRLKPEGLVLGTVRVIPAIAACHISLTLEIAQGSVLLALFDKPFGVQISTRESTLRATFQRGLAAFQKALEAQTRDPYRGRA